MFTTASGIKLACVCDADAVLDMLSSAAPLPPLRQPTDQAKGSRGCLDFDHLPAHPGTPTTPCQWLAARKRSHSLCDLVFFLECG